MALVTFGVFRTCAIEMEVEHFSFPTSFSSLSREFPFSFLKSESDNSLLKVALPLGSAWRQSHPVSPSTLLFVPISFEGIGHGSIALTIILNMYYVVVLAWAIYYMYYSFQSELPWTKCGEWATSCCRVQDKNLTGSCVRDPSKFPTDTNITWNLNWTSPTQEFWENKVLKVSNSVEERGDLDWGMVLCLAISWFICYLCVCKGVKQTGKVVYFTGTFPILARV